MNNFDILFPGHYAYPTKAIEGYRDIYAIRFNFYKSWTANRQT